MSDKIPKADRAAEDDPRFPGKIGPADIDGLNHALAVLFGSLRLARTLPRGDTGGRPGAVVALIAASDFLMRFEPVMSEHLSTPIWSLHNALLALDDNNVEAILRPTRRTGRSTLSPRRYVMIGIAVGAARWLEWTGLAAADANRAVAAKLSALGIKPTRGNKGVTADTLRRWREQIHATRPLLRAFPEVLKTNLSARDHGWMSAAGHMGNMLTKEWRSRIATLAPTAGRGFVLEALESAISAMNLADPARPPS